MTQGHTLRQRRAFTLVELLVVVAIILILLALLLPALTSAMNRGFAVQCISNMRQMGNGMLLYAGENAGVLPGSAGTYVAYAGGGGTVSLTSGTIWPYMDVAPQGRASMLRCPLDPLNDWTYGCVFSYGTRNLSYSMNQQLYNNWPLRFTSIRNPSRKILIFEEVRPNDCYFVWGGDCDDLGTDRHFGVGNYIFGDGHCEQLTPEKVWVGPIVTAYCDFFN